MRVHGQFGFVHGELCDIRAPLDGNSEQPSMESVEISEGERGGLDDPLSTGEGGSEHPSETSLFYNPTSAPAGVYAMQIR